MGLDVGGGRRRRRADRAREVTRMGVAYPSIVSMAAAWLGGQEGVGYVEYVGYVGYVDMRWIWDICVYLGGGTK